MMAKKKRAKKPGERLEAHDPELAATIMRMNKMGMKVPGYRMRRGFVLDPMGGSGTCAHAAAALGRRFIHIDPSPLSITTTLSRLKPYIQDGLRISIVSWTREGERELVRRGLGFLADGLPQMGERSDHQAFLRARDLRWDDGRSWLLLGDCLLANSNAERTD